MDNKPQLDVEESLEGFRETVWKCGPALSREEAASTAPNGQGAVNLAILQRCNDIDNVHFTSHRKIFGWPIVFAKKLIRKLLTPILERQVTYNTANTQVVSALWAQGKVISQQQEGVFQTLRTEMVAQQEAVLQTLRTEMVAQQEAVFQALRTEMEGQKQAILQALRTEMEAQKQAILQALRTEMEAQQQAIFQTLRAETGEQMERVGQQRASAFQAFRETVLGQVERLGHQHATGIQALRDMVVGQVERLGHQLHEALTERDARLAQQRTQLVLQERRITLLLEEARKRLPEPWSQEQLQVMAAEEKRPLEALYVSFEDQFRGTREDIKERCRVYLPLMKEAGIGTNEMPILDLGCGRGEWLELLREEGLQARGLEINPVLVEECRKRELAVVEGDLLAYLRTLPDASVGGVTGFHIIEHLPFNILINTLDETVRVLKPGGLAIFETPNPQNVLVGSCNFYIDPTHLRPLHSQMMQFLAEARGLCQVEILYLHPSEISPVRENTEVAKRFNEYFYGPMDYAIVGRRV